ncbi:putative ATPase [Pseudonocardia sediminis]|uniref:Putative ATPase n=1 Tax=Pseudonocardia sediminis TaxID=1397368 RepID=A0A4Q7USQ8_PSEST|nr:BTAD domain-containing putative transcriptional regulator [Pseudonocardia sediminis]RZT84822.1 putative ATPase [Pseudonocardia sediminis]
MSRAEGDRTSGGSAGEPGVELRLLSGVSYRGREVSGTRLRELLALLAAEPRSGSSAARLIADLWRDDRPDHPGKALQVLVSRARSRLGDGVVASTPAGYRLAVPEESIDVTALRAYARACAYHDADPAAVLAAAEAGLGLWDGTVGDGGEDAGDDPLTVLRVASLADHRAVRRGRALALAGLARHAEALPALADAAGRTPRDEEVLLALLRTEAAVTGPAAALARYDAHRRALRDELGADPGPALQDLHRELLEAGSPAVRHGVAHEPNPLLGRDDDVAAVLAMLRGSRVVSVVGPGGLGKTRLAHAVAGRAEQRTVHVVGLAGVSGDGDVAGEVASALGAGDTLRTPTAASASGTLTGIVDALGRGPVLLVLDNCEHVVDGAADLVSALVARSAGLRVLTTSRAPLGLSSESVHPLPELTLPTVVELFGRRARAARPGVELPADAVTELCRHLDGLPLAVELAAARVRALSVGEIAQRLDDRFALLRGGSRDAPARHRTLHAVVDWSWTLLDPGARAALRTLSVFPGGFTTDAAGHVLDADALPVLEHLVDQSLLGVSDAAGGARFRMLETVREFCSAHRESAGETDAATSRFLAWARAFGAGHHDAPFGPAPRPAMERIRDEQDNLLAALRHGLARDDGDTVAATAAALGAMWTAETNVVRVAGLAAETGPLLSHHRPGPGFVEVTRTAATLCAAGVFTLEGPRATRSLVTLHRLPPAPGDTAVRAVAAVLVAMTGGPSALHELWEGRLPLATGAAYELASYVREYEGDLDGALTCAQAALDAFDEAATPWMHVIARNRMSDVCLQLERGEQARRHSQEAIRVLGSHGTVFDPANLQWGLMLAHLACGSVEDAGQIYDRFAQVIAELESSDGGTAGYLRGLHAEIALSLGDVATGLARWREASALMDLDTSYVVAGTTAGTLEVLAATLAAHERHGRLDLVPDVAAALPSLLERVLADPAVPVPSFRFGFPWCGAAVLGLAVVDAGRDPTAAARLVALAQRLHFARNFAATMSSAGARHVAEEADPDAYAEAVAAYASLGPDELRAATLAAVREHLRR